MTSSTAVLHCPFPFESDAIRHSATTNSFSTISEDRLIIKKKNSNELMFFLPIYHQGFFHSVRRNPSLICFHRRRSLAILGHVGPKWRIRLSLHLVLGLPCRLVHGRGVHSVTLLVHLLSLNRAMRPAHPCIPFLITSMMSITPV